MNQKSAKAERFRNFVKMKAGIFNTKVSVPSAPEVQEMGRRLSNN
jgi:hypothetical protein